jgi:hypothetical protein
VYAVRTRVFLVLLGGKHPEELGEEAARALLWLVRANKSMPRLL